MHQVPNRKTMTVVFVTLLLMLACAVQPATALPPEVEADRLLLSAAGKMDQKNYSEAGQDLDKIKSLGVRLPVEFHYQNGRYLSGTRNTVEAKKSLETYLDKAGKEGKFYQEALKLYSHVEANEKRFSRFKANGNDTVTDTKTGLMWAAKDNGTGINWPNAKQYCAGYSGGGHKDWRLPTHKELAGIFDEQESGDEKQITPLIKLSGPFIWATETRGSEAYFFGFGFSRSGLGVLFQSLDNNFRALPVRGGK